MCEAWRRRTIAPPDPSRTCAFGDFGQSYAYNKPVAEILGQRLPPTIAIALVCHLLATLIGISFGILAATRQYTWVDTVLSFVAFMGMTIPRFLLALIILYILVFTFL
jgi:peptide/nickel transport system permease protein